MNRWLLDLLLLLTCLLFSAMFSGMETGIISINRVRLHHLLRKKVPGTKELDFFLRNPDQLFGTTLIGTNLCMVIVSVMAAGMAGRLLGAAGSWVSSILTTLVVLIFAEYLPKAWFQSNPTMRTRHFGRLLRLISHLVQPAVRLLVWITKRIFPMKETHNASHHIITRDELRHLTMETERTGALSERERQMIRGVFDLERKTCRDIMTPRAEMVLVSSGMSREKLLELARRKKHNRYPVSQEADGRIIGIVNILDAAADPLHAAKTAAEYMRPPQFISASTPPDEVLTRMRHTHQPIAVVVGTYDEVMGLVTLEDLLEEIVGQ
ncbi:MAG: hemolysin family protein, partial [Kiritimatiellae bacterium]|nr:hemolysin family protein [Kiritimatiellia bacterium]